MQCYTHIHYNLDDAILGNEAMHHPLGHLINALSSVQCTTIYVHEFHELMFIYALSCLGGLILVDM